MNTHLIRRHILPLPVASLLVASKALVQLLSPHTPDNFGKWSHMAEMAVDANDWTKSGKVFLLIAEEVETYLEPAIAIQLVCQAVGEGYKHLLEMELRLDAERSKISPQRG